MQNFENELIQIRPEPQGRWSRIHPRYEHHDGCIVDLGCLGWNENFNKFNGQNWSGFFYGKKRVIGVDPQEEPNEHSDFFKGFISPTFTGKADLSTSGEAGIMIKSETGKYDVITWKDFKDKFNIGAISILKINIEGSEWDLIESFTEDDFKEIDQISISFHNFVPEFKGSYYEERTKSCITKIINNNYHVIDMNVPSNWRLFLKF